MSDSSHRFAKDVGITAMEIYFPKLFVDQSELEVFDNVSAGKYTSGLGQLRMGLCTDREDINSICLTVVHKLLKNNCISPDSIGRLDVGTETLIDKSKSVKSVLMQLFKTNTDMEGVDNLNACFGGTAALFNAINWVESFSWNGKYALVVCADIAVYASGPARPTGGAGAMAILINSNAPLVIETGTRSHYMKHAYDFYKPDLSSPYPLVDGNLSIQSYFEAIDNCYNLYKKKFMAASDGHASGEVINSSSKGKSISTKNFSAFVFHSPFAKLVEKSFARLTYLDFHFGEESLLSSEQEEAFKDYKILEPSLATKSWEKDFVKACKSDFDAKVGPGLEFARNIGNMYTASVYSCLFSYLSFFDAKSLVGSKIGVFSYGSGLASCFYSIYVPSQLSCKDLRLEHICMAAKKARLSLHTDRIKVGPSEFAKIMNSAQSHYSKASYTPTSDEDVLFSDTYYLLNVDEKYRRFYKIKSASSNSCSNLVNNQNGSSHL